ncbi:LysR family transcriptional regulator [Vibrio sp. SS-MA-C1-2]|uniref:LysR family transcriptional regulator n=1 Tax=Vibrio sp. SS-MA-C1-2 TaxID=2908646 RepID=UPI001F3E52F1|nr:LysR family transcriptional regulator [Vibrio sp. SS-MA-C1-2]
MAANQLGISQSAMSHILNQGRDLFNDPLLVRGQKEMLLTDRAKELQIQLEQLLSSVSSLFKTTKFDPSEAVGKIRFTLCDFSAEKCIAPLLTYVAELAPLLEIEYVPFIADPDWLIQENKIELYIGHPSRLLGIHQERIAHHSWCFFAQKNKLSSNQLKLAAPSAQFNLISNQSLLTNDCQFESESMLVLQHGLQSEYYSVRLPSHMAYLMEKLPNIDQLEYTPSSEDEDMDIVMAWSEKWHDNPLHHWFRNQLSRIYLEQLFPNIITEQSNDRV